MIEAGYSGPLIERPDDILTPEALDCLADLQTRFGERRAELLRARDDRQVELRRGGRLQFLPDWQVAPAPDDSVDRRVEMTAPTERK